MTDPVCGDCGFFNPNKKADSRSTRYIMDLYECAETAQYVSKKRVTCVKYTPKAEAPKPVEAPGKMVSFRENREVEPDERLCPACGLRLLDAITSNNHRYCSRCDVQYTVAIIKS
jgi:CRISPR/Cas system-associated protein Cas10 (large subunit of type III CRISPR-Cas system)